MCYVKRGTTNYYCLTFGNLSCFAESASSDMIRLQSIVFAWSVVQLNKPSSHSSKDFISKDSDSAEVALVYQCDPERRLLYMGYLDWSDKCSNCTYSPTLLASMASRSLLKRCVWRECGWGGACTGVQGIVLLQALPPPLPWGSMASSYSTCKEERRWTGKEESERQPTGVCTAVRNFEFGGTFAARNRT